MMMDNSIPVKIEALRLAISLYKGDEDINVDAVLERAQKFVDFVMSTSQEEAPAE